MIGASKMSSILINLVFVILTTLTASLDASVENATSFQSPSRVPRVSSRSVKLHHHHSRSSEIKCHSEGFFADQNDCTVFYRCVDSGKGKYAVYRFQCGPGTVYDPENDICNHPINTRRTECGGFDKPSHNENEIDEWDKRPSSTSTTPQSTTTISQTTTKRTTSATRAPTTTRPTTTSTITTIKPNYSISPQWTVAPVSDKCTSDGFMGDSNDCRKFYRCVDSGRGTFIRYEFACSQSTVWDDELQGCNHAWAVKNKKCGSQNILFSTEASKLISNTNRPSNTFDSGISQTPSQKNHQPMSSQPQPQINNGWRINQTQNQVNNGTQSPELHTQITHGTVLHQSQIQSTHGKHATQTTSQIKHSDRPNQTQTQLNTRSQVTQSLLKDESATSTRAPRDKESSESDVCISDGFMGDSKDCKKFYRCVDNGKGYTRYEFSCGEGTVWDQEIEACNHAWAVKTCGKGKPQGTGDSKTSTTIGIDTSTQLHSTKVTSEYPKTEPTTAQPVPESTTKFTSTSNNKNICTRDGFVGDPNDCKRFYRCVSNGRGGFIKYEFACGQGTVWDSEIESCNHDWAVKNCGGSPTAQKPDPSETSTHSSTDKNESGNTNSESTNETTSQSTTQKLLEETTKKTTSQPSSHKNKCSREGFIGDTDDCKIFYRCVDSGNGGYTQYEYSCGQGTVWDPEIESCNHAWAVPNCGGDKAENDKITTEKYSSTVGNNEKNTQSTHSLTTTESKDVSESQTSAPKPSKGKSSCTEEGFFGDTDDCKKFYRCVDNGKGGLIKYEFTCGEGTAWDQEIEGCNHEDSVQNCGKTANNPPSDVLQDSESSPHEKDTTEKSQVDDETNKGDKDSEKEENKDQSSKPPPNSNDKCSSEGFFGYKNECKKFYRCVDNGKGGFTKYEFNCGEGTVWDPEIEGCNHAEAVQTCGGDKKETDKTNSESTPTMSTTSKPEQSTEDTTSTSTIKSTTSSNKGGGKCSSEGFYPDPDDCKKFYRCVENGKGGFTKYDFSCGEGTLWDPEIEGCNHEDAVKNCGKSHEQSSLQSAGNESSSTESTSTTEEKDCDKEIDNGSTSKPYSDNTEKCSSEGFFGVKNDCKKFYRCVDDGKGGFTKYDFNCGEGTAWDQEIESCNHKDAVKSCGDGSKDELEIGSTSTDESDNGSSSTTSTTTTESNKGTTTFTSKKPSKGKCLAEGFYSDPDDCKKFYRCVDNGKNGYTKYEFTCGEGTLWDQEIQGCNHESAVNCNGESHQQQSNTDEDNEQSSADTTTEASKTTKASSTESKTESSSEKKDDKCSSEGFNGNKQNCKKFYRCVDDGKGGYTRYDFECGEGTLWDQEIQGCNHENAVVCSNKEEESSSETSSTEKITTSTQESSKEDGKTSESPQESQGSKPSGSQNTCENEGFYGDSNDCKKFYRCVDNGKGGLTKYDFTCGDGTIWDQEITGCNHEWAVENPACRYSSGTQTQSTTQATQQTTGSQSSSSESTQNQESPTTQSQEPTTKEPCDKNETKSENNTISCPHAGFFPHPSDCKKFYRCVDWDSNGEKYSVFHFDCGEGTIWDPKLETCNYEESVYPPRDCSRQSSESGTTSTHEESSTDTSTTQDETKEPSSESQTTTTKKSTTMTEETTTTSESPTTEGSTTERSESTTAQGTTTEGTTTEGKTTSESSTTEGSSTSEDTTTTTEQSLPESTTSEPSTTKSTTSESTTSESTTSESTTSESTTSESTTPESTTSESTTSESTTSESTTSESTTSEPTMPESTTSESTTSESTTSESTTSESTTSESTTSESTTSETTTSESTTSESTTSESTTSESTTSESTSSESTSSESTTSESSTTESTTEQQTTETTEKSTTESTTESSTESSTTESTSESTTDSSSNKDCPETEEGQYLYVCPTGFKRHPKYCNLFYQCTNSPNDHDVKVAVFHCPNNTIYDEKENQCLPEEDTEQKCEGQIAEAESRRLRQLNDDYSPPNSIQTACPREGHFSFEKENKCSHLFLKCQRSLSSKRIQGFVHQCPEGYIYWTISRRCERAAAVNGCSKTSKFRRWEIPMETSNIAV